MENWHRTRLVFAALSLLLLATPRLPADETPAALREILAHSDELRKLKFPALVELATGQKVIPFDSKNPVHIRMLDAVQQACSTVIQLANEPDSPIQNVDRINEMSRGFEDHLLRILDADTTLTCSIPKTAAGKAQRSGYPDLRLVDDASQTVFYIDPKIFAAESENSSFRTFYYEPDHATGKIHDHAVHLLLGFEHDGKTDHWTFLRWHIIDLNHLMVKLKAEFQASNRDIYTQEAQLSQGN